MEVYKHKAPAMCNVSNSYITIRRIKLNNQGEKMEAIAKVLFPTKADGFDEALYPIADLTDNLNRTRMNNHPSFELCPYWAIQITSWSQHNRCLSIANQKS
jgi:hypothetical protein